MYSNLKTYITCKTCFQPVAPQWSSVIRRSIIGEALALPGYAALILSIRSACLGPAAIMDPPTGTMKFLSVLCTTTSTLPLLQAWEICLQSTLACSKNSKRYEIRKEVHAYSWPSCLRLDIPSNLPLDDLARSVTKTHTAFCIRLSRKYWLWNYTRISAAWEWAKYQAAM